MDGNPIPYFQIATIKENCLSCILDLNHAGKLMLPLLVCCYHSILASIRFVLDKRAKTCSFDNSLSVFLPEDSATMSVSVLTCYQTPAKIWNYGNT